MAVAHSSTQSTVDSRGPNTASLSVAHPRRQKPAAQRQHVIPRKIIPTASFSSHLVDRGVSAVCPIPPRPPLPNSRVSRRQRSTGGGQYLQRTAVPRDSKARMFENFRNYRDPMSGRHLLRMRRVQSFTDNWKSVLENGGVRDGHWNEVV